MDDTGWLPKPELAATCGPPEPEHATATTIGHASAPHLHNIATSESAHIIPCCLIEHLSRWPDFAFKQGERVHIRPMLTGCDGKP
jgi:hypothetical protein